MDDIDLTIQVNKLYEQYKNEDASWKGIAEYFSQEEITDLEKKDEQNTSLKFKQFAVQHYIMQKLRETLESYMSKAYLFQEEIEYEFKDKYTKKITNMSEDLAKSGMKQSHNEHYIFLKEMIENVKYVLIKKDNEYAKKLPNLMTIDYSSIASN